MILHSRGISPRIHTGWDTAITISHAEFVIHKLQIASAILVSRPPKQPQHSAQAKLVSRTILNFGTGNNVQLDHLAQSHPNLGPHF